MSKNYLTCIGLGYLGALVVSATAVIQAAIMSAAERRLLKNGRAELSGMANGFCAFGALLALGALIGPFLRAGGDPYGFVLATGMTFGLGIAFFAIRELDGLRQSKKRMLGSVFRS